MAAAKLQSEQSCLLETLPSTEAANERVSLSELATHKLGSLKWLTSRDLEVGPLGNRLIIQRSIIQREGLRVPRQVITLAIEVLRGPLTS